MYTEERKKLLRECFRELNKGNSELLMSIFESDVKWEIIGDTKFSGVFNGLEEVTEKLLSPLHANLDGGIKIYVDNLFGEHDYITCQGRGEANTKNKKSYNNKYCWVYEWRQLKVIKVTEYLDTELVTRCFS